MRVLALIDGEHHPAVVRDALGDLAAEHDLAAVLFVGGEEKVGPAVMEDPADHYGHEVAFAGRTPEQGLREVAAIAAPDAVVDLSGEPVLGPPERMRLAAVALDLGLEFRAPGMRLRPPPQAPLGGGVPVLSVIGTGKRTGKTAVAGHLASLLSERGDDPVVVAMGRGGPPEPVAVRAGAAPDLGGLLEIARGGAHAASDYLEDAVLAGVATVGCRRCGEGPAGEVFGSNVVEGARLALSLDPGVVILEGSGAAVPPVAADRTVCVTPARLAAGGALSHLGPFRLLRSHLVLALEAGEAAPGEVDALRREIRAWNPGAPVIACRLEPEPVEPVPAGARVAAFTTAAPEAEAGLRDALGRHGVEPVMVSTNLARRAALERDLAAAEREGCDLYLTELKAAAIEGVAERAVRAGARVAFLRNRPAALDGEAGLDGELLRLADEARAEVAAGAEGAGAAR